MRVCQYSLQQAKLRQVWRLGTKLHQNAFGGRALLSGVGVSYASCSLWVMDGAHKSETGNIFHQDKLLTVVILKAWFNFVCLNSRLYRPIHGTPFCYIRRLILLAGLPHYWNVLYRLIDYRFVFTHIYVCVFSFVFFSIFLVFVCTYALILFLVIGALQLLWWWWWRWWWCEKC